MSTESNIILVTDDEKITELIKPKLFLLRDADDIFTASFTTAIDNIKKIHPETILIYCDKEENDCLELIKAIKADEEIQKTAILLVLKEYNQDFILNAYDENITDYFTLQTDDAEILMRTMWSLKKNSIITQYHRQNCLLEEIGVINKKTGVYTNEHSNKIFEIEFKNLTKIGSDGILMLVSASEESKTKLNPVTLAEAIKKSIRTSDLVVHSTANRFYVFLPYTILKGAFCVWEKIKKNVGESYTVNASLTNIGDKNFTELKNRLLNSLVESISTKQDLIIANDEDEKSLDDWLEKINSAPKNFKLFKQAFNKKLDKVVTPVFFQMQKLYEEKLFQTKIEQYSNPTLSSFILKGENNSSQIKITYPGFAKINIDIVHQGLDSPENKRISLDLTELDEAKLTQILEEFIQEFKNSEK